MSFNFLFHSKFYRAQDSNLDLLEINVIQLSLPLDEHDFSFDEIAEKFFFVESSRTKSIRIINFLWHFYVCVLRTVSTDFRMWGFFILQLAVPCVVSIGNNPYQIQLIKKLMCIIDFISRHLSWTYAVIYYVPGLESIFLSQVLCVER